MNGRYTKGVPFVNGRYTKGVPFVNGRFTKEVPFVNGRSMKGVPFPPKIVYERVRGRTSRRSLPVLIFFSTPPPPPGLSTHNLHVRLHLCTLKCNKKDKVQISVAFVPLKATAVLTVPF